MRVSSERLRLRAARARLLAERYPASRESLLFFAALSEWQAAGRLDPPALAALLAGRTPPEGWLARVQAEVLGETQQGATQAANACPCCGAPPQLGVLRPQGDGSALFLACSVCRHEWAFPRAQCPGCGDREQLEFYGAVEMFPAVSVLLCSACQTYLHLIDLGKDGEAVPEADEVAVQPLDLFARERGYEKLCSNLVGL